MSWDHITAENLSFSYIRNRPVLNDVNFSIKKNEIITIIGPNGGGKTTLLRLLAGLLVPDSGSVLINGRPPAENHGIIGYVPQHSGFDRKFPMTVMDVVLSGLIKNTGFYSSRDKAKTVEALENTGLLAIKNNQISNLSGGQVQRMLIARALVSEKEILLLDEPTSNIDPAAGSQLNSLIKELGEKLTILLVTHDTGFVGNITDRVFCINRTIVEHPVDEHFSKIVASSYGGQSSIVRHEKVSLSDSDTIGNNDG